MFCHEVLESAMADNTETINVEENYDNTDNTDNNDDCSGEEQSDAPFNPGFGNDGRNDHDDQDEEEEEYEDDDVDDLTRVLRSVPVFKLRFGNLFEALKIVMKGFTQNTVYGRTFKEKTPKYQKIMTKLDELFGTYCGSEHFWNLFWGKWFRISFKITGANLKVYAKTAAATPVVVYRQFVAVLRVISEKQLIANTNGMVGEINIDLQNDIDTIVKTFGTQVIVNSGDRQIPTEPLIDEFMKALELAKQAKITAFQEKKKNDKKRYEEEKTWTKVEKKKN